MKNSNSKKNVILLLFASLVIIFSSPEICVALTTSPDGCVTWNTYCVDSSSVTAELSWTALAQTDINQIRGDCVLSSVTYTVKVGAEEKDAGASTSYTWENLTSNTAYNWKVKANYQCTTSWKSGSVWTAEYSFTTPTCNYPPTANICCQSCSSPNCTAYTGEVFTLINDSHDQNGDTDIVKSEWDILNWKTDPDLSCSPPNALCNFTPQFLSRGTYTVELYVEDSKGTSATDQETFTIKQSAIADFKCSLDNTNWKTCSDIKPNVGEVVYFLDQSSPPEGGSITSYSWTFQNGNPSTGSGTNPSTKFQSAGQKEVTLTLGVTAGPSDSRTQTIGVELPLPEWQEIAPFGWLGKIFTIISEFFDRFI